MTGAAAAPTSTSTSQNTSGLGDLLLNRMTTPAGYIGTTPTELIGRSRDLERLAAVTAAPDAGLVTVTGSAGVGKSRLVMEFFRHRGSGPGGGVEVFDFAQVTDTSVAGLMLRQLREQCYEGSPAVRKALERVAAGKHTLLFDHYEDVADDLAPLLAEFRRCCPQVRIVCVGTARLGLYGERVVRIGPLSTAGPEDAERTAVAAVPAVELFVQCARSVRPEFALTADNARHVLALCRQAGGLPLAIELAAAQITLAEPDLILERFENDPGDLHRLDHHPYSRHSSIGDMVAWVLARLRPEERTQLVHLAVFQGPFTMRAAVGVLDGLHGAAYRTMERLIDKSVLIPDERHDGELRFSIPHALRLAAAGLLARLPVHPALRRAHAEHFRGAADAGAARGRPAPGPETRADLLAAFDHWREAGDGRAMAAIAHALRGQSAAPAQAMQCLVLTEEALRAVPADDLRLQARTLEAAGDLALRLGAPAARDHLTRAHDAHRAARDEQGARRCLALLGEEAYAAGEPERARRRFEEARAAAPGSAPGAAAARRHLTRRLASVLRDAGDLPRARELALSALAEELGGGDAPVPVPAVGGDGAAGAGPGGDGPPGGRGALLARYVLATVRWREHDSAQARALFADAAEQIGTLPESAPERPECLELLAITLHAWRRVTDWRRLTATLALADHLRRQTGRPRPKPLRDLVAPILAAAAQELTAAEYARAVRSGPGLPWQTPLRLIPSDPPAPPPPPAPAPAQEPDVPTGVATALTKRELEVALLVAEGMTNRIIARELGIAEWTVVNHLRKVMRKLGCQSRVQVTRRLSSP
nr:LuxR C-terminal-related transcriptional regulator [Streptomyces sp. NBC_00899]